MDDFGNVDHADILAVYPLAAEVADLIVAEDINEWARLAKDIHEKLFAAAQTAPASAPPEPDVEYREDGTPVYREGLSIAPDAAPVVRGSITEADLKDARGMHATTEDKWAAFWRSTVDQ
jgi:hypothetical protein